VPASASSSIAAVADQAVCAVAAGARSFVAVAEWVADLPGDVAAALGVDRRCPSESTIRRLIGNLDADRFDAVIGVFVQGLSAAVTPVGRRRVLAVDGKTCAARGTPTATASSRRAGICSRGSRAALATVWMSAPAKTLRRSSTCAHRETPQTPGHVRTVLAADLRQEHRDPQFRMIDHGQAVSIPSGTPRLA
jgi:hypothetical protein